MVYKWEKVVAAIVSCEHVSPQTAAKRVKAITYAESLTAVDLADIDEAAQRVRKAFTDEGMQKWWTHKLAWKKVAAPVR